MSKGVKKIRKSINQRKKMRGLSSGSASSQHISSSFPQEEEKHGFPPVATSQSSPVNKTSSPFPGMVIKGMLSVMLFFAAALLLQTDSDMLSGTQEWTETALTEEFPFARVNQWYQEAFGEPMALSSQSSDNGAGGQALPVNGSVSESFQANGTGIMLAPEEETDVSALQSGVVTFAGNDHDTNKTVVVQHPDDSETVYGLLSTIDVHLYQFIDSGQSLGTFSPDSDNQSVYFSIEQGDDYVDPVQVIQVDDTP